jgi:uncharacterized protein
MARNDGQRSTSNRGFASMDTAKQRQIASKGGQSVPPEKRSFSQNRSLAAKAGRKGGESVPPEGRSFSQNRALAAEAGRKGGQARGRAHAQRQQHHAQRPSPQQSGPDTKRDERPLARPMPPHQHIASDESEAMEEMATEEAGRERMTHQSEEHSQGESPHSS